MPEVRLIGENGEQHGVIKTEEAMKIAFDKDLDLVEISPTSRPPVCKILNYGKFKFDQKKARRKSQKNAKKIQLKEIKMRPKIDRHDYQYKLKHINTFISKGDKVKVTMQFRGREMAHTELGMNILKKLKDDLKGMVAIEREPRLEGRQIVMILAPAK